MRLRFATRTRMTISHESIASAVICNQCFVVDESFEFRYCCFGSKSCLDIAQRMHVLNFKWSDHRHYREVRIVCAFVWLRLTEYHLIRTYCVRVDDTRASHTSFRLYEFGVAHAQRISPLCFSSRVALYCRRIFMCLFWQRPAVMSERFTVFVVCTT